MRARLAFEECAYVGTAPVPFDDYLESVTAQTITAEHPREELALFTFPAYE